VEVLRPIHADERGQGIVELAALVPFLVALLLVAGDLARSYYFAVVVADAAEQGARQATKTPQNDARIRQVATQSAPLGLLSNSNVTISGVRQAGEAVTVNVTYNFSPITPFASAITGNPILISRTATMRVR
jgi:Flp pilus assembly protein TadG